jgi:hypothetical protein
MLPEPAPPPSPLSAARRNATLRSRAAPRMRTFLWMYGHWSQRLGACRQAFDAAVAMYNASAPDLPLAAFQVGDARRECFLVAYICLRHRVA